ISAGPSATDLLILQAIYNSFVFDYCLRNSFSQPSIPQGTSQQIPVPLPETLQGSSRWLQSSAMREWVLYRSLELSYTGHDLAALAKEVLGGVQGPYKWDDGRRA